MTNGKDTYTINFIGKDCYWVKEHDCATIPFEYQHFWKLVEQKPTDEEMKILLQTEYEKGKADAIEQKSDWSEEDEGNFSQLHKLIVEKAYLDYEIDTDDETLYGKWLKLDNWLKSLKERYAWKPNDNLKQLKKIIIMKANEVPEKLYFGEFDKTGLEAYSNKESDNEVEYTRTDAFIRKAKEAFCKATCNGCPPRSTCTSLGTCREYDNFVKFLKGE